MTDKYITPSGFPEYLPEQQRVFNRMKEIFADVAESYGCVPIETPAVEYMDTLASKGEVDKEIYTIGRALGEGENEESDRGLRFDLTVPTARYVANHYNDLAFPFKRYQIGPVWRGERPQAGRARQFFQADIDVIDNENLRPEYDAEIIVVMAKILSQMNVGPFTIKVNSRELLAEILQNYGVKTDEQIQNAIKALDNIEKVETEQTLSKLQECGVSDPDKFYGLVSQSYDLDEAKDFVTNFSGSQNDSDGAVVNALNLIEDLKSMGIDNISNCRVVFDPKIARGLDYYTGTVVETTLDNAPEFGSICSGGRYADLAGKFINKKLPGFGMSIGLTRLFDYILANNIDVFKNEVKNKQYVVGVLSDERKDAARALAEQLRETGKGTFVLYDSDKGFGGQIKIAQKRNAVYVVVEQDGSVTVVDGDDKQKFDSVADFLASVS